MLPFCLERNCGVKGFFRKRKETITLYQQKGFSLVVKGFVHFPLTSQTSAPGSAPAIFNVVRGQQWLLLLKDLESPFADINSRWERSQPCMS